jgi:ACR3 family arsenite efflux pump ArsB
LFSNSLVSISQNDSVYKEFLEMDQNFYDHLASIILIFSVVSLTVTVIFLMFTKNDKQITTFKSAFSKVLIGLTIFLIVGAVYTTFMSLALNGKWDQDSTISHPAVSSSASS